MKLRRITGEIWQVGGGGLTSPEDAAIYLLAFDNEAALIDAGTGKGYQKLIENIQSCGVTQSQIEYLFLTHCHYDHTGGADNVRKACKCKIVAHELEAPYLEKGDNEVTGAAWYGAMLQPFKIDIKVASSKETFLIGKRNLAIIHTPGHSPGSVVYLVESEEKKILFGQDIHGPLDPSLLSNQKDYKNSLHYLLTLEVDILCEGHFGIFEGRREIQEFIGSFL